MPLPKPTQQSISNTLALPCLARRCYQANTIDDAIDLLNTWPEAERPMVLGAASNLVLPESIERPVLRVQADKIEVQAIPGEDVCRVVAEAGVRWDHLVAFCVEKGYQGIENLSWIPGSVGAAPVQNIGAYGVELKDCFAYAEVFDFDSMSLQKLGPEQCQFAYRDSIFKREPGRFVILRVALNLSLQAEFELAYGELKPLAQCEGLKVNDVRQKVIEVRQAKLPDPDEIPNAGSFFKNPVVSSDAYQTLTQRYPSLVAYALDDGHYKLAAGWLIDQAGWKGYRASRAGVHDKQALVLTNLGAAGQEDILNLAELIKADIQSKFELDLEVEPVVVARE